MNFGAKPKLGSGASLGSAATLNVVVGTTSWGYTTVGANTQGASWFGQNKQYSSASNKDSHGIERGAGNIGALVREALQKRWFGLPALAASQARNGGAAASV